MARSTDASAHGSRRRNWNIWLRCAQRGLRATDFAQHWPCLVCSLWFCRLCSLSESWIERICLALETQLHRTPDRAGKHAVSTVNNAYERNNHQKIQQPRAKRRSLMTAPILPGAEPVSVPAGSQGAILLLHGYMGTVQT